MSHDPEQKPNAGLVLPAEIVAGLGKAANKTRIVDPEITPMDTDRAWTYNLKERVDVFSLLNLHAILDARVKESVMFWDSRDANQRRITAVDDAGTLRAASNAIHYHVGTGDSRRDTQVMFDKQTNVDETNTLFTDMMKQFAQTDTFKNAIGSAVGVSVGAYVPAIVGAMLVALNLTTQENIDAAVAKIASTAKAQ